MTITDETRAIIRQRADFACEYCGVTETDAGGELTVDHFQPKSKNGSDGLDNLLYCCVRCNQHKFNYWPENTDDPLLWNPRLEPAIVHFLELDDGILQPLTKIAAFTLRRLRLNRPPLVANRLRKRQQIEEARLLVRYRDLVEVLQQLNKQVSTLVQEQHELLEEQRELLKLFVDREE